MIHQSRSLLILTSIMEKKQIGWYLISGGLAIFLLEFISKILSFISNHPLLGVTFISIG